MTPEKAAMMGEDARAILNSPVFKLAVERVGEHVDNVALSCDPDNKDKAQRVIISKQLLRAIVRELELVIEDGEAARIHMDELEKRNRLLKFRR